MPRPIRTDVLPRPRPAGPTGDVQAKLADDGVVTRSEARDLARVWSERPVTRTEADAIRSSVNLNLDRFEPAARVEMRNFLDHRLPRLIIDNRPVDPVAGTPTNIAKLSWTPPTTNVDGTPLNDLAGYKVFYGTSPGVYTNELTINDPSATSFTVGNLAPGTWYFAMKAFDSAGNLSAPSGEAFKTIH